MSDKLKNPIHADGWYVFSLFGEPAYADIGLCLIGKPPSKNISPVKPSAHKLEKRIAKRSSRLTVATKPGSRHVNFAEIELSIDARYYYHVLNEYPDATFHAPQRGNEQLNPLPIKSRGRIVGAIMCLRV